MNNELTTPENKTEDLHISLHNALFIGLIKFLFFTSLFIALCFGLGLIWHHYDIYPALLAFDNAGFSKESYIGIFLAGVASLPILLIFLVLMLVLFACITWLILDLGGYYD